MAETPAALVKDLEERVEQLEQTVEKIVKALEVLAGADTNRTRSIKDAVAAFASRLHVEPEPESAEAEKPRRGRPSKAEKQEDE